MGALYRYISYISILRLLVIIYLPLFTVSMKNGMVLLSCIFDQTVEWGGELSKGMKMREGGVTKILKNWTNKSCV